MKRLSLRIKFGKGISLLEVMLSLAIIAIILVLASRYFILAQNNTNMTQALNEIQNINAAAQNWRLSHGDFSGISMQGLIDRNLLPATAENNPWGGKTDVTPSSANASQYTIIMRKIPRSACKNLLLELNTDAETTPPGQCIVGDFELADLERTFGP